MGRRSMYATFCSHVWNPTATLLLLTNIKKEADIGLGLHLDVFEIKKDGKADLHDGGGWDRLALVRRLEACHTPCFCPLSCHASQPHRCSHTDANQGRLPWKEQFLKNVHKNADYRKKDEQVGFSTIRHKNSSETNVAPWCYEWMGWVGLDASLGGVK